MLPLAFFMSINEEMIYPASPCACAWYQDLTGNSRNKWCECDLLTTISQLCIPAGCCRWHSIMHLPNTLHLYMDMRHGVSDTITWYCSSWLYAGPTNIAQCHAIPRKSAILWPKEMICLIASRCYKCYNSSLLLLLCEYRLFLAVYTKTLRRMVLVPWRWLL